MCWSQSPGQDGCSDCHGPRKRWKKNGAITLSIEKHEWSRTVSVLLRDVSPKNDHEGFFFFCNAVSMGQFNYEDQNRAITPKQRLCGGTRVVGESMMCWSQSASRDCCSDCHGPHKRWKKNGAITLSIEEHKWSRKVSLQVCDVSPKNKGFFLQCCKHKGWFTWSYEDQLTITLSWRLLWRNMHC